MHYNKKEKGVISLIILFAIGFLAMGMALAILENTLSELFKNRNTVSGNKAFYTADAASRYGAYKFINDPSYRVDGFTEAFPLLNEVSESSFEVCQDPIDCPLCPIDTPYFCVKGSANNQISNRDVIYQLTTFPEGLAFTYAVFSQSSLNFKGSAKVAGNVFSNNNISFTGNNATVTGDAFSPGNIDDVDNILGEIVPGVEEIPPPQINIDDYYDSLTQPPFNTATEAEAFLNDGSDKDGEVILIEDTGITKIQDINFYNGSIITRGTLNLTGNGRFTAKENFPAMVIGSNLKITGKVNIEGVVYVMGETSFQGGDVEIGGALISVGGISDTELVGNVTITYNQGKIGDWLEFPGVDPGDSTSPPRIIKWWEE